MYTFMHSLVIFTTYLWFYHYRTSFFKHLYLCQFCLVIVANILLLTRALSYHKEKVDSPAINVKKTKKSRKNRECFNSGKKGHIAMHFCFVLQVLEEQMKI